MRREERLGVERLGPKRHPLPFQLPVVEELERDHRVDRRLPDDRLAAVLAHRLSRCRRRGRGRRCARSPSVPIPVTSVPAHVFPDIRSPSVAGSGSTAATRSRGATFAPPTRTGSLESRPSRCSVRSTSMNSSPSPYLNVTRPAVDLARDRGRPPRARRSRTRPGRFPPGSRTPLARRTARSCTTRARAPR